MGFIDLMGLLLVPIWRSVMSPIRELDMVMDILLSGGPNLLPCISLSSYWSLRILPSVVFRMTVSFEMSTLLLYSLCGVDVDMCLM